VDRVDTYIWFSVMSNKKSNKQKHVLRSKMAAFFFVGYDAVLIPSHDEIDLLYLLDIKDNRKG
jgi:hypothetical protein